MHDFYPQQLIRLGSRQACPPPWLQSQPFSLHKHSHSRWPEIDLKAVNKDLVSFDNKIRAARDKHNAFLKELGLPPLPGE